MSAVRRCAVLGSPIAHSLSPALHRAAYAELGLDWTYDPVRSTRPASRGSSTGSTIVARAVADDAAQAHRRTPPGHQRRLGAAVRGRQHARARRRASRHGYNTDIPGAIAAMQERLPHRPLGGGARRGSDRDLGAAGPGRAGLYDGHRARARPGARRGDGRGRQRAPARTGAVGRHARGRGPRRGRPARLDHPGGGADTRAGLPVRRRAGRLRGRLRPLAHAARAGGHGRRSSPRRGARPARPPGRRPGAADDRSSRCRSTCSARPARRELARRAVQIDTESPRVP